MVTKKTNPNPVIYQICAWPYHTTIKCWNQYDYLEENKPQQANIALKVVEDTTFFVDSGANAHMTNDPGTIASKTSYKGHEKIFVGNGVTLPIFHMGTTFLKLRNKTRS